MNTNQTILSLAAGVALIIYVTLTLNPVNNSRFAPLQTGPENAALNSAPIVETDLSDTTFPIIFEAAYLPRTNVTQGKISYSFSKREIGNISITSGKIIACDPVIMHDSEPFVNTFPIGEFPVQLALSKSGTGQTIAFSRILFSENPVKKWEYALSDGQEQISLRDSDFYCFSVDAGTAIFIDEEANRYFNKRQNGGDLTFIPFYGESNIAADIYTFGKHNLARFSSGYGDGCYSTFVGYDSLNQPCRLLIDFGVIWWWENND